MRLELAYSNHRSIQKGSGAASGELPEEFLLIPKTVDSAFLCIAVGASKTVQYKLFYFSARTTVIFHKHSKRYFQDVYLKTFCNTNILKIWAPFYVKFQFLAKGVKSELLNPCRAGGGAFFAPLSLRYFTDISKQWRCVCCGSTSSKVRSPGQVK